MAMPDEERSKLDNMVGRLDQQGDVLFKKVDGFVPKEGFKPFTPGKRPDGSFILVEGEVTGHAHTVTTYEDVDFVQDEDGNMFMKVPKGQSVVVEHEEHGKVKLNEGLYWIDQVREYDYEKREARRVVD